MAFRATNPALQWAALVLQVICALPHVRRALSEWGKGLPPDILEHPCVDDPGEYMTYCHHQRQKANVFIQTKLGF